MSLSSYSSSLPHPPPQKNHSSKRTLYNKLFSLDTAVILVVYTIGLIIMITLITVIVLMVV